MKHFDGELLSGYETKEIRYEICADLGAMVMIFAEYKDYQDALYALSQCKGNKNFIRKIEVKEIIKTKGVL